MAALMASPSRVAAGTAAGTLSSEKDVWLALSSELLDSVHQVEPGAGLDSFRAVRDCLTAVTDQVVAPELARDTLARLSAVADDEEDLAEHGAAAATKLAPTDMLKDIRPATVDPWMTCVGLMRSLMTYYISRKVSPELFCDTFLPEWSQVDTILNSSCSFAQKSAFLRVLRDVLVRCERDVDCLQMAVGRLLDLPQNVFVMDVPGVDFDPASTRLCSIMFQARECLTNSSDSQSLHLGSLFMEVAKLILAAPRELGEIGYSLYSQQMLLFSVFKVFRDLTDMKQVVQLLAMIESVLLRARLVGLLLWDSFDDDKTQYGLFATDIQLLSAGDSGEEIRLKAWSILVTKLVTEPHKCATILELLPTVLGIYTWAVQLGAGQTMLHKSDVEQMKTAAQRARRQLSRSTTLVASDSEIKLATRLLQQVAYSEVVSPTAKQGTIESTMSLMRSSTAPAAAMTSPVPRATIGVAVKRKLVEPSGPPATNPPLKPSNSTNTQQARSTKRVSPHAGTPGGAVASPQLSAAGTTLPAATGSRIPAASPAIVAKRRRVDEVVDLSSE